MCTCVSLYVKRETHLPMRVSLYNKQETRLLIRVSLYDKRETHLPMHISLYDKRETVSYVVVREGVRQEVRHIRHGLQLLKQPRVILRFPGC
jgi:hypothetical protein